MKYRELEVGDIERIREINGTQFIGRAQRNINGERELVDINWQEKELPNGTEWHIQKLETSIENGGKAYGCLEENNLIGCAVINVEIFGMTAHYILLDQLFISLEYRDKGVGRKLLKLCCQEAKIRGGKEIYMCRFGRRDNRILLCHWM